MVTPCQATVLGIVPTVLGRFLGGSADEVSDGHTQGICQVVETLEQYPASSVLEFDQLVATQAALEGKRFLGEVRLKA